MGVSHSMNRDQLNKVLTQFEATTEAIKGIEKKVERVNGYINSMHRQREVMTVQADHATGLVDKISDSLNERSDEILDYFQRTLETFADPVEQIEFSVLNMGLQTVPAKLHKEFGPMLVPAVFLVLILTVSNSVFGFLLAGDRRLATVLSLNAVYGQEDTADTASAGSTVNILSIFAIFHVVMVGIAAAYVVIESCRKGFRRRRQRRMKGESASWWDTFAKDFNILEEADGLEEEQERIPRITAKSKYLRADGLRGSLDNCGSRWVVGEGVGPYANASALRSQLVGSTVVSSNARAVVARDVAGNRRAWLLPVGETATILDMDDLGNLRLATSDGTESGWVQAEAFTAVTVPGEGEEALLSFPSIGAWLQQMGGHREPTRARLGSSGNTPQGRFQNVLLRAGSEMSSMSAGADATGRGAGVGGLDLNSPSPSRPMTPVLQPLQPLSCPMANEGLAVVSIDEQSPEARPGVAFFESLGESNGSGAAANAVGGDFNPFPRLLEPLPAGCASSNANNAHTNSNSSNNLHHNPGPQDPSQPGPLSRSPSPLLAAVAAVADQASVPSPERSGISGEPGESARTSSGLQAPSTASNSGGLPRLPIAVEAMGNPMGTNASSRSATASPPTGGGSGSGLFVFPTNPAHSEATDSAVEEGETATTLGHRGEGESAISLGKRSTSTIDSKGNHRGKERPRLSAAKMGYSSSTGNSKGHTTPTAKATSTSFSSNTVGSTSGPGQSQKTAPVSSMLRRLQEFSKQNIRSERGTNSPNSSRSQDHRRRRNRSRERSGGGTTPGSEATEGPTHESASPRNARSL